MNSKNGLITAHEVELADTGSTTIKLHGNCMWPIAKSGDFVTLTKTSPDKLQLGDIGVYRISPTDLHLNTLFKRQGSQMSREHKARFLGKVTVVKRGNRMIHLDQRSAIMRLLQVTFSPANPYTLSLPKTIWKKLRGF